MLHEATPAGEGYGDYLQKRSVAAAGAIDRSTRLSRAARDRAPNATRFSEPDCAGGSIDVHNPSIVVFQPNGWRRFSEHNYALPPARQSVKVSFSMTGSSNDSGMLYADHFFFGPADGTLFKNGFE
jgi:hypothetical protein